MVKKAFETDGDTLKITVKLTFKSLTKDENADFILILFLSVTEKIEKEKTANSEETVVPRGNSSDDLFSTLRMKK